MELKDLVGEHLLSGFDIAIDFLKDEWSEESNVMRFVLDGITYKAIEDPSDGYRSYMQDLITTDEKITNTFEPQKVIGKMKEHLSKFDENGREDDVIEFIDFVTGKVVLEIGTANTNDYYPYCIMNWHPENLAINAGK